MESSLRVRCGSAARSLMLAAILALICLVWGAGTADAEPSGPVSGPTAVVLPDSGLPQHDPASPPENASAAAPPVLHPLQTVPARALPRVSGPGTSSTGTIKDVPLPAAHPAGGITAPAVSPNPMVNQAPPAVATVAASVAPVVNQVAPVLTHAAPVIHQAVGVIDAASGVVPVPVQLSVPALVPVPTQLPATRGKVVAPGARPAAHAHAARPQPSSTGLAPKAAVSGPGLAQLRVKAPALGALTAGAGYFAPSSDAEATLDAKVHLWLSAAQGSSGSSISGPGGGGHTAGDAAGSWNPPKARSSAQAPDLAQAPATSPSFDPGSSPD